MIFITRKFSFSASHRIFKPELTDEENFRLYGKCSNPSGHGHNYGLEVRINGKVNEDTGYILDLTELKEIVNKSVIDKIDHKNLNVDVDFMKDIIPTTENIAIQIWKVLKKELNHFKGIWLYSVKINETENNIVEYRGDNE